MSTGTSIEWTDATWNPLRGTVGRHTCIRISPGCTHCYAATMNRRFGGPDYVVGADTPRLDEKALLEPLRWRKPRKVFVCSMTDLFLEMHTDEWIDCVFNVMAYSPRHTFQVLTKRPDRMLRYLAAPRRSEAIFDALYDAQIAERGGRQADDAICRGMDRIKFDSALPWPLPNVWLGVSCENQQYADERIPLLLQTPAAVRWVSAEPLLGPVNLHVGLCRHYNPARPEQRVSRWCGDPQLDWVVVGGESGPGARPFDLAWGRSIVEQCKAAGVPCFVKQIGSDPQCGTCLDRRVCWCADGLQHVKNRKGGDISEWPIDLQVRQYPNRPSTQEIPNAAATV